MRKVISLLLVLCLTVSLLSTNYSTRVVAASANSASCLPLKTYTLKAERVTTFDSVGGNPTGYIDGATDLCTIKEYIGDWVKVNYPVPGGTKDAYCPVGEFFCTGNTWGDFYTSNFSATAYKWSTGNSKFGSVYVGDSIYVIGERNGRKQLVYNISGGWKLGWVDAGYLTSLITPPPSEPVTEPPTETTSEPQQETAPATQSNTVGGYSYAWKTPLKAYTISTSRVPTYSSVNGKESGYITGSSDLCTINEIYTNGWVKVTYPLDSGGTKTAYTKLSAFIDNTSYSSYEKNAVKASDAYRRSGGIATIGSVYYGDSLMVVSAANGRYQVIYNVTGSNTNKLGWVPVSIFDEPSVNQSDSTTEQAAVEASTTTTTTTTKAAAQNNVIGGVSYANKVPLKAYTISTGKVNTYSSVNGSKTGYITGSKDLCTILEIYTNGWVKVNYPLDGGGTKTAYTELKNFVKNTSFSTSIATMYVGTDAYCRESGNAKIGYVDKYDEITIVSKSDPRYQIVYPLSSGGYKLGWIEMKKTEKPMTTTTTTTQPQVIEEPATPSTDNKDANNVVGGKAYAFQTPIKAYTIKTGKVTTYDKVNGKAFGYISGSVDLCTINQIYTNGWVKVTYPLTNGKTKTGYCELKEFIQDVTFKDYQAHAPFSALAYRRSSGEATIGSVDKNDHLYIVSHEGTRTQVIYPAVGCRKLGWLEDGSDNSNNSSTPNTDSNNSNTTQNQNNNTTLVKDTSQYKGQVPMMAYTLLPNNVTTYDKPNGTAVGMIAGSKDLCTIQEFYTNGWVKVTYPLDKGGERTAYCEASKFIVTMIGALKYKAHETTADSYKTAYRRASGDATIGSVDKGDKIWVIYQTGSRQQVIYNVTGTSTYKVGWIEKTVTVPSDSGNSDTTTVPDTSVDAPNVLPETTEPSSDAVSLFPSGWKAYVDASSNGYSHINVYSDPTQGHADGYVDHREEVIVMGQFSDCYYIDYAVTVGSANGTRKQRYIPMKYISTTLPKEPDTTAMLETMRKRAEAITNLKWTAGKTFSSFNANGNNSYFKAGQTYYGMPYTMLGKINTSKEYTDLIDHDGVIQNRTIEGNCSGYGYRYGPKYGNCCASLAAEVFGMLDSNGRPISQGCSTLRSYAAGYEATTHIAKFNEVKPGDALFTENGHVIWVYSIEYQTRRIEFYEQTKPKAQRVVIENAKLSNGYFYYGGNEYTIVMRKNIFNSH